VSTTVWHNGKVWINENESSDALGVVDGLIVAHGADALALQADETIDLKCATLLPGFGDGHAHPVFGGTETLFAPVRGPEKLEQLLEAVKKWADENPDKGRKEKIHGEYYSVMGEAGVKFAASMDQKIKEYDEQKAKETVGSSTGSTEMTPLTKGGPVPGPELPKPELDPDPEPEPKPKAKAKPKGRPPPKAGEETPLRPRLRDKTTCPDCNKQISNHALHYTHSKVCKGKAAPNIVLEDTKPEHPIEQPKAKSKTVKPVTTSIEPSPVEIVQELRTADLAEHEMKEVLLKYARTMKD
jgi:hypothetical protein